MVDFRIKTFLTLCSVMNYRKIAELLNMTQPAVTQHIHYLEEEYHCKLFLYDRHTLTLTPEGELLKNYAENISYQEKRLFEKMGLVKKRSLRIGATKTIGEYVITEQVAKYLSKPQQTILVDVDNTNRLLELLKQGELDFALIEGFFDSAEFESRLYRSEPFIGVCSPTHRFAGKTVPLDEVLSETLFLREEGSGTRMILEQLLSERNCTTDRFNRIVCISNFGLMSDLIARNIGITFAYQAIQTADKGLAEFQVEGWKIYRDFNYVFLNNPDAVKAIEEFEELSETVGENK
ncbi:DNA-binding transcriptional regulator, LysR family [Ruminococcus flavefaciens]|uniref:DNA-binding transcriptional regulator, LysR family n=1 Tax=Ruminococcus flavefaciens TaxID=1265 RepID=A0A1H6LL30_RUMFL|nr:LysR family transcriptional regulator [Ruminococcus flavefaciens]SEH85531.1 DNA-binding transcriptional regulator, LysR family [Ruminococcus flavefaciens]